MANIISRLKLESGEFDSKIKRAGQELLAYSEHCKKMGLEMGYANKDAKDFAKALGNMNTVSQTARGKLNELTEAFVNLKAMYNNMTDAEKQNTFGKELAASLDKLKTRIDEAKQNLNSVNAELGNTKQVEDGAKSGLEGLTSALGINVKSLAGWGAALTAGKVALDVAKDAFFASEANVDEWGRTVQSAQGVYEGFLNAINNGDISGFLGRIDQIVQAARQAYDELDKLGTMKTIQGPQISAQQTENERMRMMIQTGRYIAPVDGRRASMQNGQLLTPEQIKRLEQQLQGGMTKMVGLVGNEVKQTGKAIDAYYNSLAKQNGMTMEEFRKGTSSWAEYSKKMAGYDAYKEWDKNARIEFAKQGGRGNVDFDKSNPYAEYRKWGTFRVDKTGDNSLNDLVNLIKQRDQQASQAYSTMSQSYRTMNRAEGITLNKIMGRGGSGGGKTTPSSQAAKQIEAAEQEYSRALEKAALEVQGGTITEAQQKQKQLQATEALWSAYGKASDTVNGTNADYKSRQEQLGQEIVKLGGEVKTATEAQKAAEKAARELEQAQKKLADAQRELATAQQTGNLKDVYKAQEKVTSAQTDVNRLQKEITQVVNVVPGKVELPQIPETVKPIEVPITTANIDAFIGNLKERISQSEVGTDLYNNLTKQLDDATMLGNFLDLAVKNGIDAADLHPQEFWKKIFTDTPGDYIDDDVWKKLGEAMSKGIGKNLDVDTAQGKVGKSSKQKRDGVQDVSKALSGVSSIVGGLESMGIQMSDDVKNVIGVVQGAMSVIQGIQTVISIFQTTSMTANTAAMVALTSALWANTATSWLPFANGGIVHAANGYRVPGNSMSGDNVPALLNSGELVLNRAQQGNLASQLQGGGILDNLHLETYVDGRALRIVLNNESQGRLKGKYVTSNKR